MSELKPIILRANSGWINGLAVALVLGLAGCLSGGSGGGTSGTTATSPTPPPSTPLVVTPSRTGGVAPLGVIFDATGSSLPGLPFHDVKYTWDFGDSPGPKWAYGARPNVNSKNVAYGPVAAHVFETAGTYTVTLTAFDGTNTTTTTQTITVSDPNIFFSGINTVCVASGSTPTAGADGCPSGADVRNLGTFNAVVALATTYKRILLKHDDTWTLPATGTLSIAGPGLIGSYGVGAAPVIQFTPGIPNNFAISLDSAASDWRLVDLEFVGAPFTLAPANEFQRIVESSSTAKSNLTMLRIRADGISSVITTNGVLSGFILADSNVTNLNSTNGDQGIFLASNSTGDALLGNQLTVSANNFHIFRGQGAKKVVLSNNTLIQNGGFDAATIRGNAEHIVISDNHIQGGELELTPQNTASDERISDVIVERNFFSGVDGILRIEVLSGATARNNIFDGDSNLINHIEIRHRSLTAKPPGSSAYIYHNTFYQPTSSPATFGRFSAVHISSTTGSYPTGTVIKNNLAYAPQSTSNSSGGQPSGVSGTFLDVTGVPAGTWVATNNTSDVNVKSDNPNFSATPIPPTAGSWKPTNTTNIQGVGTSVPVWDDFFLTPQAVSRSLGAVVLP